MAKTAKADYVLRKQTQFKRLFWIFCIFFAVLLLIEAYGVYNYLAFCSTQGQEPGVISAISSLLYLFSDFSLPLSGEVLKQILHGLLSLWWLDLIVIIAMLAALRKAGKFKKVEHGSARWMSPQERKAFARTPHAIPLADNLYVDPKHNSLKNINELVIGDSGAGKSFRKLIPDIMQQYGNYIITDVKGSLYRQLYKILDKAGYKIRVLNLIDPQYSNCFNPLNYLVTDTDIDRLVNTFVINSRKEGTNAGEGFWEDTMSMLLTAAIKYVLDEPTETKTFARVMDLVITLEILQGQIAPYCEFDKIMQRKEMEDPFNAAVLNYKLVKQAPAETLQSVIISLTSRLRLWTNEEIRILTNTDEIQLDKISEEKTAIFVIIPDNDNTYRSISAMFFSTVLQRLCYIADVKYNGRLPQLVSLELDEAANIGIIPKLDGYISTVRSRNIRAVLIFQSLQQIEKNYEKAEKTIIANCAILNYLGTSDITTREQIVKMLGKATIDESNTSRNLSLAQKGGGSESLRGLGRELLTLDELEHIGSHSVVILSGCYPVYAEKYRTQEHELFHLLGNDDVTSPNSKNNVYIKDMYADLYQEHRKAYEQYKQDLLDQRTPDFLGSAGKKEKKDSLDSVTNDLLRSLSAETADENEDSTSAEEFEKGLFSDLKEKHKE